MFVKQEMVEIQALDGCSLGFSVADEQATFPGEQLVNVGILTSSILGNNVFWSGYWATVPGLTNAERSELKTLIQNKRNALAASVEGYDAGDAGFQDLLGTLLEDFPDRSTMLNTQVVLTGGGTYVIEAQLNDAFGSDRARLDELVTKIWHAVLLASSGWSEV